MACAPRDIDAVFALAFTIAGAALPFEYAGDYVAAIILGLLFQYFAIAPMRGLGICESIKTATKADILSPSAFNVDLFAWMALMVFVFFPGPHQSPVSPMHWQHADEPHAAGGNAQRLNWLRAGVLGSND